MKLLESSTSGIISMVVTIRETTIHVRVRDCVTRAYGTVRPSNPRSDKKCLRGAIS